MAAVFKKSLAAAGTPEFASVFAAEAREQLNSLPLEEICTRGGWPYVDGRLDLFDFAVTEMENGVAVSCAVSFEEVLPTCCAGGVSTANAAGRLSGVISRASGEAEFSAADL